MASKKKKSEWPPSGWKVDIKVNVNGRPYKCYINTKTGEKAFTKRAVHRCIKKGRSGKRESQSHGTKHNPKTEPENKEMILMEANDSLNLPPGWTLEWKIRHSGARKGTKYKCITELSTGNKFYSMPEVYRYLKSRNDGVGSSKQAKQECPSNSENNGTVNPISPQKSNLKKKLPEDLEPPTIHNNLSSEKIENSEKSPEPTVETKLSSGKMKVVVERTSDEDLPSGWIKEIRIKGNGNNIRRDPPTPPSNIKKTNKGGKRKHSINEGTPTPSSLDSLVEGGNHEAHSKRITRSSSKVRSSTTCEPSLEPIPLLPEPSMTVQETLLTKPEGQVPSDGGQSKKITKLSSKVRSSTSEPSVEPIPLLPELPMTVQETLPTKPDAQVSSDGGQSKKITKLSSKVRSSTTCEPSLEPIPLLPEPSKTVQETLLTKPEGQVSSDGGQSKKITRLSSKVRSSTTCEPSLESIPLLPEPPKTVQETLPAKPEGQVPCDEGQSKRRTRSSIKARSSSTCEPIKTPQETGPVKPNADVSSVEDQSNIISASSFSKVESSPTCEPSIEQILLLSEPAKTPQETGLVKPNADVSSVEDESNRSSTSSFSKVDSYPTCEPYLEKTIQETVPVKPDDVSLVGGQSKKRSRSTKVQSTYSCEPSIEQIPLLPEHDEEVPSRERTTRSTSKVQSTYSCEPVIEQITLVPEPVQVVPAKIDAGVSCVGGQSKRRRRSSAQVQSASMSQPNHDQAQLLPDPVKGAPEIVGAKPNEAVFTVEGVGDVRQQVDIVDTIQNNPVSNETDPSTLPKHKSDNKQKRSGVRKTRVNKRTVKERKKTVLSSCSSKRHAQVEAEVPLQFIPTENAHFCAENYGKTDSSPVWDTVPNEPQQRTQALDDYQQNPVTSQPETYWSFDVNIPTVIQTQVDSVENINYLSQEYIEAIFLQDEGPPGFSHYPRNKITQSTIDQLFEDPVDTIAEDMIVKSPEQNNIAEDHKITEEQTEINMSSENCPVLEEPTSLLGRNNQQAGSQFCYPSPLWSDPCLEFAFKTLTGALPLDDNVAIQDYMEHQIRTCDQVNNNNNNNNYNNNKASPDVGMSSFCQNVEAKMAPQFSDDNAGFMKYNGFNSHKPSR